MIAYIFEFCTLLALFGLGYLLLVSGTSNYHILRKYIVGSVIVSIGLPFVPDLVSNDLLVYSLVLPETTIIAQGTATISKNINTNGSINLQRLLPYILGLITLFFAFRFLYALYHIAKIIFNAQLDDNHGVPILKSAEIKTPFSFFNYVVLPEDITLEQRSIETIIAHEKLHIKFNHSLEKIFIELFKVCAWWHPVSWMFAKELELVHEYQVDDAMTEQLEFKTYKKILLQLIIDPQGPRMINPISSNIKKRLLMMNQKKIKSQPMRFILLFSVMAIGSLIIHSCQQDDIDTKVKENTKQSEMKSLVQNDPYEITLVDTITTFDYDTYEETVQIAESKDQVFITPDQMPLFPGCDQSLPYDQLKECSTKELLRYIYTNLVYPEKSRKDGIEGMVVVKFVVSKSGYIFNKEFVRTPDVHLQQSVNAMLTKMNEEHTWIPGVQNGKKVNVQYTLPVKFKLEDK